MSPPRFDGSICVGVSPPPQPLRLRYADVATPLIARHRRHTAAEIRVAAVIRCFAVTFRRPRLRCRDAADALLILLCPPAF